MNLNKDIKDIKVGIFVPCYKRPEYTAQTIKALEEAQEYKNVRFFLIDDGSQDSTENILRNTSLPNVTLNINKDNLGLRSSVIRFFNWAREEEIDVIGIVGNDVLMPKNWLNDMLVALTSTDLDAASCNYMPSNPAFTQGFEIEGNDKYRLANNIVGLWFMDRRLTDDIVFEDAHLYGISGSTAIMSQIKMDKDPRIGWITTVMALDRGHWSGLAEGHIKSIEHEEYYAEVGRKVTWTNNSEGQ